MYSEFPLAADAPEYAEYHMKAGGNLDTEVHIQND